MSSIILCCDYYLAHDVLFKKATGSQVNDILNKDPRKREFIHNHIFDCTPGFEFDGQVLGVKVCSWEDFGEIDRCMKPEVLALIDKRFREEIKEIFNVDFDLELTLAGVSERASHNRPKRV